MKIEQPPVMLYTNFHYYEDLAGGASYTPPARMLATACNEYAAWSGEVKLEFFDGAAWQNAGSAYPATPNLYQDDSQSIRTRNADVVAYKFSFTGVLGSGAEDYHYYEDLASGASYTLPVKAIAIPLNADASLCDVGVHLEFYDGTGWVVAHGVYTGEYTVPVYQDDDQNIRITNGRGYARKINLTGITWS